MTTSPALRALDRVVLVFTSWFGLGYLPKAPGTWGTLGTLPLWWASSHLDWMGQLALAAALTAAAVVLSARAEEIYGAHDVQRIVIDESAGIMVTAVGVPFAWPQVLVGFILFRALDMTKPGPIRWLDKNVGGGLGVVLDDVAAGALACGLLHGARLMLGGWW